MAGILLLGDLPFVFNGGKSQVNFNSINAGEFPFLNAMKTGNNWNNNTGGALTDPTTYDSDNYPTSVSGTGCTCAFHVPTQTERPGNYVITWDGNGTIFCGMANTLVSGSKTSSTGSGRYVFSTTDSNFSVGISSLGSPRITNMKCFHVDDETAINAGQVFGTKFKQRIAEANFGVLRFLNWGPFNNTNMFDWSTARKPLTSFSYAAPEYRQALIGTCTFRSAQAYDVTAPSSWGGLVDKAIVTFKFDQAIPSYTTPPFTINVGGTGDIPVLNQGCGTIIVGGNSVPVANTWATCVYDAVLNSWIKQGGDVSEGNAGLINGVPFELMLRLCIETRSHPWWPIPGFCLDPMTDFVPSAAAYVKANAPSWMIPRFEGPNELWNNTSGFNNTGYANAKATAYGWGADTHNWYGKVASTLGQALATVFGIGNLGTTYHCIVGVQTATGQTSASCTTSSPRLSSNLYINSNPLPAQSPYSKTAGVAEAWRWVSHVCNANYMSPWEYGTIQECIDAYAYNVTNSGNPTAQAAIAASYVDTLQTFSGDFTVTIASPAVLTSTGNTLSLNQRIYLATTGKLPTGMTAQTAYYVLTTGDSFTVSASPGGSAVNTSGTQSGTHSFSPGLFTLKPTSIFFQNWKAWAQSFSVNRLCFYEGGYSPDYTTNNTTSPITGATQANPCVLTLATTVSQGQANTGFGNPAVVGMSISIASVAGMTQLNGNTYTVSAINVGGDPTKVSINVDSSAFSAYTSGGTATYVGSSTNANALRLGGKSAPLLQGYLTTNYNNAVGLTGGGFTAEFPSCFQQGGSSPSNNAWSVLETIYTTSTPPQWAAIIAFNQ